MDKLLANIINKSKEMNVASLRDATLLLLLDNIKQNNIKKILEIGTGIGYSAYQIHKHFNDLEIDTIEKSNDRYQAAYEFLKGIKNINIINNDCFKFETNKKYDLIIIDGPKNNQIELFKKLLNFSHEHTIFFVDNIKLRNVRNKQNKTNNHIKILKEVDDFYEFLNNYHQIDFRYFDLDDGVMIGKKQWN